MTTHQPTPIDNLSAPVKFALSLGVNIAITVTVWWLSVRGQSSPQYEIAAILIVVLAELWPTRDTPSWKLLKPKSPQIVMGIAAALIIALLPKLASQVAVAVLYLIWRQFESKWRYDGRGGLLKLLVVQITLLEACFLLAAIWRAPAVLVMILVWAAGTTTVWQALIKRSEPSAGILATSWGIILAELSWIFLVWLVSYIVPGNYLIVPQPVLVLSAVAYCCGSIYLAQRRGQLNKSRLTEYLLVGLILIWIIIAWTPWRGTL